MADWKIKVLIDGDCPLCASEEAFLRWLDGGRGLLAFEDIADPDFDPARYGATREQLMEQIHGVLPDGRLVKGMDVFRRAYDAVGWGWVLAPTNWPIFRPIADAGYRVFAKYRPRLPFRSRTCATGHCGRV